MAEPLSLETIESEFNKDELRCLFEFCKFKGEINRFSQLNIQVKELGENNCREVNEGVSGLGIFKY